MSNLDLLAKAVGGKVVDNEPKKEVVAPQATEQVQPQAEEPKQELKESSLQTEERSNDSQPSIDVNEIIKERFDNKFSSIDEIKSALEARTEQPKIEYANEMVEQLDKMVRDGWSIEEYMSVYSKDYNSLDDEQVIKEAMRFDDKDLSGEDLDFLFDSEYGYDTEIDDDKDVRLKQIKIKKEAAKARQKLNEFKESYQPKSRQEQVSQQQQYAQVQERWSKAIESANISEITSDSNFRYEVPQDALSEVKNEVKDLSQYFNKYVNPDGTENVSKLIEDQLKVKLFDKAISAAMTMAKSEGREEVVSNRDNVVPPKENRPNAPKSAAQQLYEQAKQKGFF